MMPVYGKGKMLYLHSPFHPDPDLHKTVKKYFCLISVVAALMFIPCICPGMMQRAHSLDDAAMLMYEMPDSAMVLVEKKEPRLAGILSSVPQS